MKVLTDRFKWKDRSDLWLRNWRKDNYSLRDSFLDDWVNLDKTKGLTLNIETIHYNDVSVEDFMKWFEEPSIPCIINGATDDWPALKSWNHKDLIEKYGEAKLWVGEDDKGYALWMKFADFIEYMIYNWDDSPLYLFESNI